LKISKKIILNKLDDSQIQRYSRNITLREIGNKGQIKLLNSKVLIVGAGGLGSPLMLYLTAAGVGTIGLIDNEKVDLSNLNRQVIHKTSSIGRSKVKSAIDSASAAPCLTTALHVLTSIPVAPRFRFMESILHYIIVEAWSPNISLRLQ